MSDIKRFDPVADTDFYECWASMNESEKGDYVLYEDHKAAVRDMHLQILKLKDDLEAARMEAGGYA